MPQRQRAGRAGPRRRPGQAAFVGRGSEIAALTARLDAAASGAGGVIFVKGEPGIGKTRLLSVFSRQAADAGWQVLIGRAYDTEGMPPYLPFVEALKPHVGAAADEEVLRQVLASAPDASEGPGRPTAGSLALLLRPPPGPETERYQLFDAVTKAFLELASSSESRGLLLCLDDLHWADRSTLLLFQHMARQLGKARLLVLATYRDSDVIETHPLFRVLAELTREPLHQTLSLAALSPADCASLIAQLAPGRVDRAVANAIHQRTDGNPFFVEEVVSRLRSDGRDLADRNLLAVDWGIPEGVRQVVGLRISRLEPATRELLQTAAVLGEAFPFDLLAEASGMDASGVTNAVEAATRDGLLRSEGESYAFSHALVRSTLYEGLSLPRRRQLHGRAAQAMETLKSVRSIFGPGAIGHHWRLAARPAQAVEYLLAAGDAAIPLAAWEEAARHWEAAQECMAQAGEAPARQARLLEGLGDLYFLSGYDTPRSVGSYERALALFESAGDRVGWARAHVRAGATLGYPAVQPMNYPAALEHLRAAETVLNTGPESLELGEMYAGIAHLESHTLRSSPDQLLAALDRLEAIAANLDNEFLRVFVYSLRGHYLGHQGRLAEGLALEERACEAAASLKGQAFNRWSEHWREYLQSYSAVQAEEKLDSGTYQFSRPFGHPLMDNWTALCCGLQSLELLDPLHARVTHERIRDGRGRYLIPQLASDLLLSGDVDLLRQRLDAGAVPPGLAEGWARFMLASCEGHWDVALKAGGDWVQRFRANGSTTFLMGATEQLLRLHRAMGDAISTESMARERLEMALGGPSVKYEFAARAELALVLAETGRLAEAEANLARCREIISGGEDWRGLAGRLLLAEAVCAAGREATEEPAAAHFESAIAVFRRLSLPWDEAEAYELWATSCCRFHRGRTRRAFIGEKVGQARGVCERIGAGRPWLERLDAEESRIAGDSVEGATPLPDGLTEREGEILKLVALGRSNREIADQLTVSDRTIERHIANIYSKTRAHNRIQAAAYAQQMGLIPPTSAGTA